MAVCSLLVMGMSDVQAQSLKDILNSDAAKKVLNTVKELSNPKFSDLQGTWQYHSSACRFKSDDLLEKAGGVALAEGLEKQLDNTYAKVGLVPGKLTYTFNSDSTFTSQLGKKKMKGTYSYDPSTGTMTLKYFSLLPLQAKVMRTSERIALLFDADRLLKLVSLMANSSRNSALSTMGKVAGQYDGLQLGFDLNK